MVPTFIHDGHSIFQSLAIMEYLDDIQPEPRLVPKDTKERAYARSLALMTIADVHPLRMPRVRNRLAEKFGADARAIAAWGKHWTREGLATYERLLARRPPSPFAFGAEPVSPISASPARWWARIISRSIWAPIRLLRPV